MGLIGGRGSVFPPWHSGGGYLTGWVGVGKVNSMISPQVEWLLSRVELAGCCSREEKCDVAWGEK